MNTRRNGATALGAVALIVLISGCAGVKSLDVEAEAVQPQQQQVDTVKQQAIEALRQAKQAEARDATVPSVATASIEALRQAKQAEARDAADTQARWLQHQVEHGASSDRLR